jgi:hypothetical protein
VFIGDPATRATLPGTPERAFGAIAKVLGTCL